MKVENRQGKTSPARGRNWLAHRHQHSWHRRHGRHDARAAYLVAFLCFAAAFLLACRAGSDMTDSIVIGGYNAYWNCPTPSPVPTQCRQEPYPGPTAGPGTPPPEPVIA